MDGRSPASSLLFSHKHDTDWFGVDGYSTVSMAVAANFRRGSMLIDSRGVSRCLTIVCTVALLYGHGRMEFFLTTEQPFQSP